MGGTRSAGQPRTVDGCRGAAAREELLDERPARLGGDDAVLGELAHVGDAHLRRVPDEAVARVGLEEAAAEPLEDRRVVVRVLGLVRERVDVRRERRAEPRDGLHGLRVPGAERVVHVEGHALGRERHPVARAVDGDRGDRRRIERADVLRGEGVPRGRDDVLLDVDPEPLVRVDEQVRPVRVRHGRRELRRVGVEGHRQQLDVHPGLLLVPRRETHQRRLLGAAVRVPEDDRRRGSGAPLREETEEDRDEEKGGTHPYATGSPT